MAHEIEDFLVKKFINGVDKSKVHRGQLKKLKKMLGKLEPTQFGLTEIRGYLYYLNNLMDECLRLSVKFPLSIIIHPHNVRSFREVGNDLEEVTLKIKEEYPEVLPTPQGSQNASLTLASVHPGTVHGFDEELIAVERLLLPPPGSNEVGKFKAVGIAGVAGVGKTTLCRELLKRKGIRDHFIPRICVQLSEHDQKVDVVEKILDSLGVEKEMVEKISKEFEFEGLVCALYAQLMGKRYLIVLDNACREDDWYRDLDAPLPRDPKWGELLAFGLPKGYGGTVIVTGREREVVEKMVKAEENVHRLQPLVDKESTWSIFVDALGDFKEKLHPKDDVKEEILKKCAGVPLAAKMIGEIMKELMEESQEQAKERKELSTILRDLLLQGST